MLTAWVLAVMMVCTSLAVFAETDIVIRDKAGNELVPEVSGSGSQITYGSADTELSYVRVFDVDEDKHVLINGSSIDTSGIDAVMVADNQGEIDINTKKGSGDRTPDIIIILNESFYDLSVLSMRDRLHLKTPLIWSQEHMTTNYNTCNYYYEKGCEYVYLSSEITEEEIKEIKEKSPIKIMSFFID